jgi:hypothetical protein
VEARQLSERFPAEFDKKGMLRATRNPLGNARKIYAREGMIYGNGITELAGHEGFYYAWFHGLQPLMGKEGWDAGLYQIRPSFELRKPEPLCWYLHSRCVVQLPVGYPHDPTFERGTRTEKIAHEINQYLSGKVSLDELTKPKIAAPRRGTRDTMEDQSTAKEKKQWKGKPRQRVKPWEEPQQRVKPWGEPRQKGQPWGLGEPRQRGQP